jgi:hypothetical protein
LESASRGSQRHDDQLGQRIAPETDKGFSKNAARAILCLGNSGVEPDVVSVDAADCISPECEQFAEGKHQPLAVLLNDAAAASRNNKVALLDQMVDGEHQILQFMTTEHFTLQTAKSATVAEANGRSSLFIGSVSSAVVALAFIGQVSALGQAFFLFGLVLFPSLFFLGIVTFDRVLQTALENWIYACEINRIRHYYVELAPQIKRYFIQSTHDDAPGPLHIIGTAPARWQLVLTASGMVGVINSILAGVFTGMLTRFAFSLSIYASAGLGIVVVVASIFAHHLYQINKFAEVGKKLKIEFPSDPD